MLDQQRADRASLVDVLDHVLDKGIVVDAWVRVSVAGISLITIEARVVVASIVTYLKHASVGQLAPSAAPSLDRRAQRCGLWHSC
jgi:gas vesicle structural protein